MARDGSLLEEKGEGDASYNAMDGVHDEDVKRREFSRTSRSSRVWMGDSMRFSMLGRDYAANLYNFAWAQAVQNKPLVSFVAEEATSMGSGSSNSGGDGATNVSGKNDGSSMENMEEANGDLEKEEGELEEGEIVLASADADSVAQQLVPSENDPVPPTVATSEGDNPSGIVEPEAEIDFDSLVVTTLEELEAINEEYAEKCFEEACSRLGKTLEGLQKMVAGSTLPVLDALLQQALMGVRTVYSVYTKRNDQGGEAAIFRLLSHMKKQVSAMLTPEQMKEVNEMMESVAHMAPLSLSVEGTPLLSKIRADYHPLLDLHANHDEDSLPSPTREGIPALPDRKSVSQSMVPKKDRSSRGGEKDGMAFSTYQQKYLRTSFLPPDELPSPTPSEEGNVGDGDLQEVSSSSVLIPSILSEDKPKRQGLIPGVNLAGRAPLKSRDPRLKLTVPAGNAVGANPRKHSFVDESLLEKHTVKRQRHDLPDRTDFLVSMRKEGRIEDNSVRTGQQGIVAQVVGKEEANPAGGKGLPLKEAPLRNDQVPNVSSSPLVSLLSLLKGVAGDPSIVTHLIKEQQRLAVQAQLKTSPMEKTLEAVPSTSGPPPSFPVSDLKIDGKIKAASQTDPQDGAGKIRMKSRDPRRILHNNMLQKSDHDQLKPGAGPTNLDQNKPLGRAQAEHAQLTLSPQSTLIPSAPKQFNKGAKSLADTSPASQAIGVDFSASQTASQLLPTSSETVIVWPVADGSNDQQKTSTSKPSDWWGNMDHLLDGYDERQKAAIQLERARRIEEQNKMIADRKLCLVLDLDHTLLNSAKFSEVDPVHGEILWRKEEQDREKPQRSLFRFPHMGMWTKLRPGIWNFLEKTSKLFELHLYTMGNKLYATEMAKVLDPSGVLFAGRVISKGDDGDLFDGDERLPKSKDLDGVLGMESAVVIIDDSVKVWPHHKLNLIVVERYTYFPCSRRQFGMPGPSLLEIDHDERLEDGTLASALAVIEKIHQTFFAAKCPGDMDVRNIIATEQRRILAGCRIVFSRIFRVGEANPHLHPLWQTAEQFGATCTNQIDDQVTHVVAYSLGTDKVNWALSTGRFVVHPGWVEASALLYRRASEADFAIKPPLAQPP